MSKPSEISSRNAASISTISIGQLVYAPCYPHQQYKLGHVTGFQSSNGTVSVSFHKANPIYYDVTVPLSRIINPADCAVSPAPQNKASFLQSSSIMENGQPEQSENGKVGHDRIFIGNWCVHFALGFKMAERIEQQSGDIVVPTPVDATASMSKGYEAVVKIFYFVLYEMQRQRQLRNQKMLKDVLVVFSTYPMMELYEFLVRNLSFQQSASYSPPLERVGSSSLVESLPSKLQEWSDKKKLSIINVDSCLDVLPSSVRIRSILLKPASLQNTESHDIRQLTLPLSRFQLQLLRILLDAERLNQFPSNLSLTGACQSILNFYVGCFEDQGVNVLQQPHWIQRNVQEASKFLAHRLSLDPKCYALLATLEEVLHFRHSSTSPFFQMGGQMERVILFYHSGGSGNVAAALQSAMQFTGVQYFGIAKGMTAKEVQECCRCWSQSLRSILLLDVCVDCIRTAAVTCSLLATAFIGYEVPCHREAKEWYELSRQFTDNRATCYLIETELEKALAEGGIVSPKVCSMWRDVTNEDLQLVQYSVKENAGSKRKRKRSGMCQEDITSDDPQRDLQQTAPTVLLEHSLKLMRTNTQDIKGIVLPSTGPSNLECLLSVVGFQH